MSPFRHLAGLSVLLIACPSPEPKPDDTDPQVPTGEGIFTEGCPVPGQATARVLTQPASRMRGDIAASEPGDFLLANEHAAYVITRPEAESTYWYYGGALADAAAVEGCEQLTDDLLDDLGISLATLEITQFERSRVRGFEAQTVEIIHDGADGQPAVVRARGRDATHWLVEHTLQNASLGSGRTFDLPYFLDIVVDYILPSDSPVLEVKVQVIGTEESPTAMAGAALVRFADVLEPRGLHTRTLDAFGLNLDAGMPWVVASHAAGAMSFSADGINLASLNIGGVDILLDLDRALTDPIEPQGNAFQEGDTYRYFISVGPGESNSVTPTLASVRPDPLGLGNYQTVQIAGTVLDGDAPVGDALVQFQADPATGTWETFDLVRTQADGTFSADLAVFDPSWAFRAVASTEGRPDATPVPFDPLADDTLALALPPRGTLLHTVTDVDGDPIPARVEVTNTAGATTTLHLFGAGEQPLDPGTYSWVAARGWEWTRATGELVIPEGGTGTLEVSLEHVLDTSGFLSVDTHIHSEPSPDSRVPMARQLLVGASHGLDIAMSTDHEAVVGFERALASSGLTGHIGIVSGLEMTAVHPEHMTAFPVIPDGSPRGGFVRWFGLDFPEIVEAQRTRGASVVLLNHPGYMDRIGWDMITGVPTLTDPTALGQAPGSSLWSYTFDGLEVMNGASSPFRDNKRTFEKWQGMLNHGHRMTAVGSSDDHHGQRTGYPRTYFASSTDDPGAFVGEELDAAMLAGRAFMSAGAFLRVGIGDAGLGELARVPDGQVDVAIQVSSLPEIDIDEVVVFANCDEVARIPATAPDALIKLDTEVRVPLEVDAHIAVAAFGSAPMPPGLPGVGSNTPRAMSNAIYVDVDGSGTFDAPGGKSCDYQL